MNSYSDVPRRMEYIQKLFLNTGSSLQKIADVREIITFLDTEPPEYRSVAYESASFEIALRDLETSQGLDRWKEFRETCADQHTFHMDIGLGWAFAKTGLSPDPHLLSTNPVVQWMVFDGLGYYYGLFKGRSTLKNKKIPEGIEGEGLHGFDQGLGRRLWYIAKGNVNELHELIKNFPANRHPDLFRGIGIACGYVGGNREDELKNLIKISSEHNMPLQTGIVLAAISRVAANAMNADMDLACRIICNKTINDLIGSMHATTMNLFYLYKNSDTSHYWLTQLESELLQTS